MAKYSEDEKSEKDLKDEKEIKEETKEVESKQEKISKIPKKRYSVILVKGDILIVSDEQGNGIEIKSDRNTKNAKPGDIIEI